MDISINGYLNQWISQSMDISINGYLNQWISQSMDISINGLNHSIKPFLLDVSIPNSPTQDLASSPSGVEQDGFEEACFAPNGWWV